MEKEVFISYSSENSDIAHDISDSIENIGISTWIAPESIPAGSRYGSAITQGISNCEIFLLVYSDACNNSEHVANEIDAAIRYNKDIIPFCIDDSKMSDEIQYYLSRKQQIHAYPNPSEKINDLLNYLVSMLGYSWVENDEDATSPIDNNVEEDDYNLAMEYDDADECEKALPIFIKLAKKGHSGSQLQLGYYYEYGDAGLKINYEKSIEWYQKSVAQGNAEAMNALGGLYCYCQDDRYIDIEKGVSLFKQSAKNDYYEGYLSLGDCYKEGLYFEINNQNAYDNYMLALELAKEDEHKGVVCSHIAFLFDSINMYDEAFHYFNEAISYGCTYLGCLKFVGKYYYLGYGVERDYDMAFKYFMDASKNSELNVDSWLGSCYLNGYGVSKDVSKAIEYFNHGVLLNDSWSMIDLADIIDDSAKAYELYSKAADLGNDLAMESLSYFYDKGGELEDRNELKKSLQRILDNSKDIDLIESTKKRISDTGFRLKGSKIILQNYA